MTNQKKCPVCKHPSFTADFKQVFSVIEQITEGVMNDYDILEPFEIVSPRVYTCDKCGHEWGDE